MKHMVLWGFWAPVLAAVHMTYPAQAWAEESRICMGLNIPADAQPCRNNDTVQVYGNNRGNLPQNGLDTVGNAGFNVFLAWVNATYGGEENQDFGYTVFNTQGYYQGEPEQSRVMLLFFARATAIEIGRKFQRAFCQDSVYVNTLNTEAVVGSSVRLD